MTYSELFEQYIKEEIEKKTKNNNIELDLLSSNPNFLFEYEFDHIKYINNYIFKINLKDNEFFIRYYYTNGSENNFIWKKEFTEHLFLNEEPATKNELESISIKINKILNVLEYVIQNIERLEKTINEKIYIRPQLNLEPHNIFCFANKKGT